MCVCVYIYIYKHIRIHVYAIYIHRHSHNIWSHTHTCMYTYKQTYMITYKRLLSMSPVATPVTQHVTASVRQSSPAQAMQDLLPDIPKNVLLPSKSCSGEPWSRLHQIEAPATPPSVPTATFAKHSTHEALLQLAFHSSVQRLCIF